jgi:triacylglycerol lipase
MLARALRLSHALEITFYVILVMSVGDTSFVAAIPLALLILLALRAVLIAVSYAYARAYGLLAPRLSRRQRLLMVLGEYASFVVTFIVIMPFERWWMGDDCLQEQADEGQTAAAVAERRRPPILLIHGYGCSRGAWWWLRGHLEAAGWTVATISLEPIYTSIDNYVDPVARRVDDLLAATGAAQVILVGHSMGGLVARAYLQRYGDARVARLLTLGTPHQGSELARLGFGDNGRQMRPHSPWLQALASPPASVDAVAFYSPHDNFVMPPALLELRGAQEQRIDGVGHLAMLYSPRVIQALLTVLEQTAARHPGAMSDTGEITNAADA